MKKLLNLFILFTLIFSSLIAVPALAEDLITDELSNAELNSDVVFNPTDTDTIEFTLRARWGYVRGNPQRYKEEKNYSGSIFSSDLNQARLNIVRPILFERGDEITNRINPITFTSKIFSHYDGLVVNVKAKANTTITVKTAKGEIVKTAKQWFNLDGPALADFGNDEMLVVNVSHKTHRKNTMIIFWGKKNQGEQIQCITTPCYGGQTINFSGSLIMDENSFIKLKKPLRFESGDKITEQDRNHISWTSEILNHRDGLLTLMLPKRDVSLSDGFTITFNKLPILDQEKPIWSKHYTFGDVASGVREEILIGGYPYILVINQKNIIEQLIKAKTSRRLYLIKDNIKNEVNDLKTLASYGYKESEAVIMDDDELETLDDGEELLYADGSVVSDGTDAWLIENNLKRRLTTDEAKNRFAGIRNLLSLLASRLRLDKITQGLDIDSADQIPDESLVKISSDTAVWKIVGNKRQVFANLTIFDLHRLNFSRVKTITQEQLEKFSWAPPIKYPDGALVKIPTDPKTYILQGGIRRWIETEDDLLGLGFDFSDIVDMSPADITNYPEGDPIVAE